MLKASKYEASHKIRFLRVVVDYNVDMRNDCMLALVDILYKHIPFTNPNAKRTFDSDLSTIGNYIQKNYLEIKGLDALSEHFSITKSHLCRVFKEHTGITITHYINALKIQRACLLLCESKIPIHDIYKMCGLRLVAVLWGEQAEQQALRPLSL